MNPVYTSVFHPEALEREMWETILCGLLPVTEIKRRSR